MSMRSLESAVLAEARVVFRNRKLRLMDLAEWSTGAIKPADGEVVTTLPGLKVNVAVKRMDDKRPRVWVLEALTDYEPGNIAGVYSSEAKAEAAKATSGYKPDDWEISEHAVDE